MASFASRNPWAVTIALAAGALALSSRFYSGAFNWLTLGFVLLMSLSFAWLMEEGQHEAGSWALGKSGLLVLAALWIGATTLVFWAPWE